MDLEGFGNCTNHGECQAACPKSISIDTIVQMNRDYTMARITGRGAGPAVPIRRPSAPGSALEASSPLHAGLDSASGGADAVEKTTYVAGDRGDAGTPMPALGPLDRRTRAGLLLWVIVVIAVLVALVYVPGIAR
jgi:hypothetical protein